MKYNLDYIDESPIKNQMEQYLSTPHIMEGDLSVKTYKNALVLPSTGYNENIRLLGGVVDCDGQFIEASGYCEYANIPYDVNEDDVQFDPDSVLYVGCIHTCYGHSFTDNIKKLWYLKSNKWHGRIIYIAEKNKDFPIWQRDIYRILNIDTSKWEKIVKPTRFVKVVMPDDCFLKKNGLFRYSIVYKSLINQMTTNCPVFTNLQYDKIYLTRTGFRNIWREYGEESIELEFKKAGFKIISPEKYNIAQQIYMMQNAKVVVATEGSCAHNMVFCKQGTKAVVLRKADYPNAHQLMIAQLFDLDLTYIDAHHSSRNSKTVRTLGPFYLCITKHLAKYLGHTLYIPYWLRPSYWLYYKQAWAVYGKYIGINIDEWTR